MAAAPVTELRPGAPGTAAARAGGQARPAAPSAGAPSGSPTAAGPAGSPTPVAAGSPTPVAPSESPTPVAAGATWAAVGLVTASLPLHAAMLLGHGHGPVLATVMAAMVLWCLWCAAGVVRASTRRAARTAPSPRAGRAAAGATPSGAGPARAAPAPCPAASLRHLWAMALAMVLLHVVLLTGFPFAVGGHQHGAAAAGVASGTAAGPDGGGGLMLAVVGLELAICFACAVALRAGGQSPPAPGR